VTQCFAHRHLVVAGVWIGFFVATLGCRSQSESSTYAGPDQTGLTPAKPDEQATATGPASWNGWRGNRRDAYCASLPAVLPRQVETRWSRALSGAGLGGVAATREFVVVGDRDLEDTSDVFHCFQAENGATVWTLSYPATGELDYGNLPRATPLIEGEHAYLYGAFSDLTCVKLLTGQIVWQKNLHAEYGTVAKFVWGTCASPLIVDDKLIVNPGAADAAIVALDPLTGEELWRSPGPPPAYGSFLAAELGGRLQVIGHDRQALGGWDVATGVRLWTLKMPLADDFNVPTPVQYGSQLLITSENNGTRLYRFDSHGVIDPTPVATNEDLAADICTPVVVGRRGFCVWGSLYCLDLDQGLATLWAAEEPAAQIYASVIGGPDRVMVIGAGGELILIDANSDRYEVVSRLKVFQQGAELYAHPALVGNRLYIRGENSLACVDLATP